MFQITYERPREKLQSRGASSLSVAELIQLIIGSGTNGYSAAKIARKITTILEKTQYNPSYKELLILDGLGDAKVCQILAVIELARRFSNESSKNTNEAPASVDEIRKSKHQMLVYDTYDGSSQLLKRREITNLSGNRTVLVRRICANIITDSAAGVSFAIGSAKQVLQPSTSELIFLKELFDGARLLQITVKAICIVNEKSSIDVKGSVV